MSALAIPTPQPDEALESIRARILMLNGHKSLAASDAAIIKVLPKEVRSKAPILEALANICGQDSESFARRHTYLPFQYAVVDSRRSDTEHLQFRTFASTRFSYHQSQRKPRYCARCIVEDMEWHGFSYWRRTHQIVGISTCLKHSHNLIEIDADATIELPHHAIERQRPSNPLTLDINLPPIAQRYQLVASDLLERTRPASCQMLLPRLRRRAVERGLSITLKDKSDQSRLSRFAAQAEGSSWVKGVLESTALKNNKKIWDRLDQALYSSTTGVVPIVLAAALLFEDADECLQQFEGDPPPKASTPNTPRMQFNHGLCTRQTFILSDGEYPTFAKALGRNPREISSFLKFNGLPSLSARDISHNELKALGAFERGLSLNDACRRFRVDTQKLERLLRIAATPALRAAAAIEKRRFRDQITTRKRAQ